MSNSSILLQDIFEVKDIDPALGEIKKTKKFDKVSRLVCISEHSDLNMILDINSDIYKVDIGDKLTYALAKTLDLKGVQDEEETCTPLFMIDTANCGLEEDVTDDGESRCNKHEVEIAFSYVKKLVTLGIKQNEIAIITPYRNQVKLLKTLINEKFEDIEIGTVDGFQGREKEVIILSLVRSNPNGEIGFLSEERRLNVAITRAKRQVCLICDSTTLRTNKFLSRMTKYFHENSDCREATDYF